MPLQNGQLGGKVRIFGSIESEIEGSSALFDDFDVDFGLGAVVSNGEKRVPGTQRVQSFSNIPHLGDIQNWPRPSESQWELSFEGVAQWATVQANFIDDIRLLDVNQILPRQATGFKGMEIIQYYAYLTGNPRNMHLTESVPLASGCAFSAYFVVKHWECQDRRLDILVRFSQRRFT